MKSWLTLVFHFIDFLAFLVFYKEQVLLLHL